MFLVISSGESFSFAPGITIIWLFLFEITIFAMPPFVFLRVVIAFVSTFSDFRFCSESLLKLSSPKHAKRLTFAPSLAAATASFAPFPP